jgi:hypothetical protein
MKKSKSKAWFVHVRKSYLPSSWQGLCIYFLYVAIIVTMPVVWYETNHPWLNLFTSVLPLVFAAVVITTYIASRKSK